MLAGFTPQSIDVGNGIEIAAWVAGKGPPLLLLHGYPETHVCWHRVAPELAREFTVGAPDLRGYGASSKPPGDATHAAYAKRTMAADQLAVMTALGFPRFAVAGHDRGGRVAHRLALDHPDAVERLAVLDIVPTATMYRATDRAFAEAYYHWFFLIQPFDFPERLIGADPAYFVRHTLASWCRIEGAISEAAMAAYIEAFTPEAIHASCEDYRAAASIDLEHDADDAARASRLTMPVLALWGTQATVGRLFDVQQSWRDVSAAPVTGHAIDCGHFLPEERPGETAAALRAFLRAAA